jgi:hypothetical protein
VVGCVAVSSALLVIVHSSTGALGQEGGVATEEASAQLLRAAPANCDAEWWGGLVGAACEGIVDAGAPQVAPHVLRLIRDSLVVVATQMIPRSDAEREFRAAFVRWATRRLLEAPPTPAQIEASLDQVAALVAWMETQAVEALGPAAAEAIRSELQTVRESFAISATTFLTGSVLRPLSEEDFASVKSAFLGKLQAELAAGHGQDDALPRAVAAASVELHTAGGATTPLPPALQQLLAKYDEAEERLQREESQQRLRDAEVRILDIELEQEILDAQTWALVVHAVTLNDVLLAGAGTRRWSAAVSVSGPGCGPAHIAVVKAGDGSCSIAALADAALQEETSHSWRWTDADITVTKDELVFRRPLAGTAAALSFAEVADADSAISHFDDNTWACFLAGEWHASQVFWPAAAGLLGVGAGPEDGGGVRGVVLESALGLVPFCSQPLVVELRREPDGVVRMVAGDGVAVGSLTYERAPSASGAAWQMLGMTLGLRTVTGAATMRVTRRGEGQADEDWRVPLDARIRRIAFMLGEAAPGVPVVADAHAYDERGAEVASVRLSECGLFGLGAP